jgi:hypothetical protein
VAVVDVGRSITLTTAGRSGSSRGDVAAVKPVAEIETPLGHTYSIEIAIDQASADRLSFNWRATV